MARPWRLRHKLVLGLILVVGSVGLLLGGTLFGQSSYVETMQTTERKLDEMQVVIQLRDHIHRMAAAGRVRFPSDPAPRETPPEREQREILEAVRDARTNLGVYRTMLDTGSVRRGLDPEGGEDEHALIGRIEAALDGLEAAVRGAGVRIDSNRPDRLIDDPKVGGAYDQLLHTNADLLQFLRGDIDRARERSTANIRRSLVIAAAASAVAVVLVFTLMYYFRVWVFAPIRAIQAGVHRVHAGDFDHPIRLHARDELHELADEFNAMTARLRDTHADLARQVEEQSQRLVAAEKMVSVGFLAAGVAHEINNPLASIAFCAEALERRLHDLLAAAPAEADTVRKYLHMIGQEAFRCKQITERLLSYSRNGGGRSEPTDLSGLVQNVLDLVRHHPQFAKKHVVFRPDGPVVAAVDPHEIQGVVNNLVVNALENMDDGGSVEITLRATADAAELRFADTGVGMRADVLRHIFEPFYTRSKTGKGTGLGLFISKRAVTNHGGTLTAASDGPGRGSTFTVRLPLRTAAAPPADAGPTILAYPPGRAAA